VRVRSFPWQIWRTNYAYPATRKLGLAGSLSWYTNTRWKMAGGLDLYLSANAGPRGGCGDPADPCVVRQSSSISDLVLTGSPCVSTALSAP
jgi:hypothetical protein